MSGGHRVTFCRCVMRSSTTAGSARVEVSPRLPNSSSAILRRMRRMILPERVFGRPGRELDQVRRGDRADLLAHPGDELLAQFLRGLLAGHQRHIGVDALALDVVRIADDRGFRHLRVRDERRFDFRRAHAVAGDVDHVVDAAGDPVVAVLVAPAAVAGEVLARRGGEIGLHEALVVAVDGAHLAGPGIGDDEVALAAALQDLALRPRPAARRRRSGSVAEPASASSPRQRRDQDAAGLRLPPGVDDRAAPSPTTR